MTLHDAAFACLLAFCALGVFDGVYFHIIKYRLHEHPAARTEHLIHTLRGFVFSALGLCFFAFGSSGLLLLLGCTLVICDIGLEIVDILVEKEARRELGGIDPRESVIHVFASSLKFSAIVLILLTKTGADFRVSAGFLEAQASPLGLKLFAYVFSGASFIVSLISLNSMIAQRSSERRSTAGASSTPDPETARRSSSRLKSIRLS